MRPASGNLCRFVLVKSITLMVSVYRFSDLPANWQPPKKKDFVERVSIYTKWKKKCGEEQVCEHVEWDMGTMGSV